MMNLVEKNTLKNSLHSDWTLTHDGTRLYRDFNFKNFKLALEFAYKYGLEADKTKHHPDVLVKWQHCIVEIWSHNINDLAPMDFELAKLADQIYPTS